MDKRETVIWIMNYIFRSRPSKCWTAFRIPFWRVPNFDTSLYSIFWYMTCKSWLTKLSQIKSTAPKVSLVSSFVWFMPSHENHKPSFLNLDPLLVTWLFLCILLWLLIPKQTSKSNHHDSHFYNLLFTIFPWYSSIHYMYEYIFCIV